jgi:hypothetical protein
MIQIEKNVLDSVKDEFISMNGKMLEYMGKKENTILTKPNETTQMNEDWLL